MPDAIRMLRCYNESISSADRDTTMTLFNSFDFEIGEDGSNTIPYGSFDYDGQRYEVDLELWHESAPEVWVRAAGEKDLSRLFYSYDVPAAAMQALNAHLRALARTDGIEADHDGVDFILISEKV